MATGEYAILGDDGSTVGVEAFRCAAGPMGWRYVARIETRDPTPHRETVDLVVDAAWRPVRVRIETGEHVLEARSEHERLVGHRDGEPLELPLPHDRELDYLSPAFNVVTARRLAGTDEVDVWYFEPVGIEPAAVRQRYELRGTGEVHTPVGRFRASRWGFEVVGAGYASELWVAGDVLVRYTGLYELRRYEPGATGPIPD